MAFLVCSRRERCSFQRTPSTNRVQTRSFRLQAKTAPHDATVLSVKVLTQETSSPMGLPGVVLVMRTADLVAEYIEFRRQSGVELARKTMTAYFDSARYAGEWYPPTPEAVTKSLQALRQLAPESEKSHLRRLRTIAGFGQATYGIPNPFEGIKERRVTKRPHRVFSSEEYTRLRDACRDSIDYGLLDLLMGTGIRVGETPLYTDQVSEVHRITAPDGNVHEVAYLTVSGKTGPRYVPITVRERVSVLDTARDGRLWVSTAAPNKPPTPLSIPGLVTRWRRLVERSGLEGRKLGPHTARHTFASTWVMSGGGIEALQPVLGHESIKTTEIYVHRLPGFVAAQLLRHDPLGAIRRAAQITSGPGAA